MTIIRHTLTAITILLAGCATPQKFQCTKDELLNWHAANAATIRRQISYPLVARRAQREGRVIVNMSIAEDGSVQNAAIKQSSGFPALDAEALMIAKAKYSSPICGGQATSITVNIPVEFKLDS